MPTVIKEITLIIPLIRTNKDLQVDDIDTEVRTYDIENFCKEVLNLDKEKCIERILDILYEDTEINEEGEL